jgi:hypothetical protein
MMHITEDVQVKLNLEIDLIYPDGQVAEHHRSHNIITNTGRLFMAEVITPATLAGASFTRHNDEVVRYIGFGIGGSRQTSADALNPASALSIAYPGTNAQTDIDVTVAILERPVQVTNAPLYMREINTPGTFTGSPIRNTRFVTTFSQSDINFGSFASVPISEIGLYKSGADSSLPNGTIGAYPGAAGELIAYDTFNPIEKTGLFSIQVRWEWRF